MKTKTVIIIMLFMLIITLTSQANTDLLFDEVLIVGIDVKYPPYEFVEDDQALGYNIDLIEAVADIMHLNIEIRPGIWNDIRTGLETGEIDILTGMLYSDERDKIFDFSTPHILISHSMFIRSDSEISSLTDANGKAILVQNGDLMHDYLIENNLTDHIITFDNQEQALIALADGTGDVAFLNKYQAYYFIKENNIDNVNAVGSEIRQYECAFAVKEGETELLSQLNEGLGILKSTGKYDEIYDKWFGIYEQRQTFELLGYFILFIGLPLILIILISLIWTWTLRREVSRKTEELQKINADLQASIKRINQTQKQLIQNEKMAALGRMVAGITHEVSTPLGVIRTAITTAEYQAKKISGALSEDKLSKSSLVDFLATDQELLHIIMENLKITINHLESFKEIAVDQMGEKPRHLEIGSYLEFVLMNLKPKLKRTSHKVNLLYDENYRIHTYPGAISQIITNFITNSLKYGLYDIEEGIITISVKVADDMVTLTYSDSGHGIPEEDLEKIYEPFFTTGLERGGSGIGLNIVYNLVTKRLNGKIDVVSGIDKGVVFTITFPANTTDAPSI